MTTDAGAQHRVNASKTLAFADGIDPTTGTLIYQQAPLHSSNSDLYTEDLATKATAPIPGVNTRHWDCCADREAPWLLYAQNQFRSKTSPWKVLLYNTTTHARKVLDSSTNGCYCLTTGNLDGNFATWSKGPRNYIWDISAAARTARTSPPRRKIDYDPYLVDPNPGVSGDETLYWARSGKACGAKVSILKAPLSNLSATTKLYALPKGKDTFSIAVDSTTGNNDLYFERFTCRTGASDIFKIPNA